MELNEEVKNEKEPKDGIALVKKYEDLLKGANKKIINIIGKQGEILKKFRFLIYFKIRLHKFLWRFPVLKMSTLAPSYCKSNFKLIKKVCRSNADVFGDSK